MNEINKYYDKLSMLLTDYEHNEIDQDDLYMFLVKIQNNWEDIIRTIQEDNE